MLLGHWYLVTPKLSPAPLRRMMWLLVGCPRPAGVAFVVAVTRRASSALAGRADRLAHLAAAGGRHPPPDRASPSWRSLASLGGLTAGQRPACCTSAWRSSWPARSPGPASPTSPASRSEPDAGHGRARSPSLRELSAGSRRARAAVRGDGGRRLGGAGRPLSRRSRRIGPSCEPARNGELCRLGCAARGRRRGRLPAAGERRRPPCA